MSQTTVNQRLKFLAEKLADSVRAFGLAIGDSTSNTQKYVNGATRPSPEYLELVLLRFREIDAHWLLTGKGEPFLPGSSVANELGPNYQKNISSNVLGTNHGTSTQTQGVASTAEASLRVQLKAAEQLIAQLKSQLQDKEHIIKLLEKNN